MSSGPLETLDVDGPTLAKLLGVTVRRVQQLVSQGALPRSKHGRYDAMVCVPAFLRLVESRSGLVVPDEGQLDPAQERARRDRAAALRLELMNAVTMGEVVRIADVTPVITEQFSIVRNRLLAIPSRLAMNVPSEQRAAIRQAAHDEVCAALGELSADQTFAKRAAEYRAKIAEEAQQGESDADNDSDDCPSPSRRGRAASARAGARRRADPSEA